MMSCFATTLPNRLRATLFALACGFGLSACSSPCPPHGFESAADYNGNSFGGYALLSNAWTRNPRLEKFLSEAIRSEGFVALTGKYGMQCVPRHSAIDCPDCYACNKAYPAKSIDMFAAFPIGFAPGWKCVDFGEMFVRAEVGPGSTVHAMTYLDRPTRPEKN